MHRPMTFIRSIAIAAMGGAGMFSCLCAHQVNTVEFEFQDLGSQWELRGEMDVAYMRPETRNVIQAGPFSREELMKSTPAEWERIRRETAHTLHQLLHLTFAGEEVPWDIEFPDFDKAPLELPVMYGDWALLTVRLVADARPGPGELRIHWTTDDQAQLVIVSLVGGKRQIFCVSPGDEQVLLKMVGSGAGSASPKAGFGAWIRTGYRHVLPLGFDHMLFIFGLFLMVLKWRPLMWQSLLFTLSHSATLALCVLGWVRLDPKLVEILIAFSIAFIGVENLVAHKVGKLRYALVFGFGLVHGMGFASVLADKVKGVPRDELIAPLLGFNIGVELAQITVLAASFLLFRLIESHQRLGQIVGSGFVALAGAAWMIERMFF